MKAISNHKISVSESMFIIWAWIVLLALIIEVGIFSYHHLTQQKHTD